MSKFAEGVYALVITDALITANALGKRTTSHLWNNAMKDISQLLLPILAAALAAGVTAPAAAQATEPAPPHFSASPAAAPYLLGPDDVLSIQVLNFPELCVPQVAVPSDGRITVPVLTSEVSVAGKTTAQVARMLQADWSKYYNGVFVSVTLTARRHQSVQIYGLVAHPASVDYQPGLRLTEVLAAAGGAAENGDLSHVTITHPNGTTQTVDASVSGPASDVALGPSDAVYVPLGHQQVSVLGEVAKPGSYDYKDKMTVLDALKDADNVNLPTADLSHATLSHDGTTGPLDLNALLKGGQTADNIALAPGDSIFIPVLHNRIYVDGAVRNPGYYAFKPGDRLVDAINGSGGTIAGTSDTKKITVVHQDKAANTYVAQTVDYGKFLQHGDGEVNLPLQPNDAIYVPIKGATTNPITILGGIIGIGSGARVLSGH